MPDAAGVVRDAAEVRAVEVTASNVGPSHGLQANHCPAADTPILPSLLDQIPPDQEIASVTGPSHACKNALRGSG